MDCTEEVIFNANMIQNSTLEDGLDGWAPFGTCTLSVHHQAPAEFSVDATDPVEHDQKPNGQYILAADRSDEDVHDKKPTAADGPEKKDEQDQKSNGRNILADDCCDEKDGDEQKPNGESILSDNGSDEKEVHDRKPSGRYILAADRSDKKDGPCQVIPGVLKPRITYLVTGWISLGSGAEGCHPVHVNVRVDDECWVPSGAVCAEAGRWTELKGSFRLNKEPCSAAVYVQGPPAGVDVRVMDLQIFAVDRKSRFSHLKRKTDKVRKRDVVLKFGGAGAAASLSGASIRVMQTDNSFPFGCCINMSVIQNPAFVDFFTKHFDWAVFENELKWYWTEAQQGQLNYNDADALLDFCDSRNKPVRGHCVFWAVDNVVQPWVKALGHDDLMSAVDSRIQGLLSRYAGRFPHYDVNNEMLHGSFFKDRLGDDINAYMFRGVAKLDPGATLFVNDYNVECGNDPNATPEKYIEQIEELQQRGAIVGGIGLQGHVTNPSGEVICDALDKLSTTEMPVWITELDVCEPDASLRADDLEVVLREAYAHPAVEGVMFWGFMQGHMWRQDACLVNADGTVNEAGQRFVDLRREWTSHARGHIDKNGQYKFRGFRGTYVVELTTATAKLHRKFTVDKGDTPLELDMDL